MSRKRLRIKNKTLEKIGKEGERQDSRKVFFEILKKTARTKNKEK